MSKQRSDRQTTTTLSEDRDNLLKLCADLARSRSILIDLNRHLRNHGFAGSTNIPLTVYLSTLTRVFDDPVSLVIKGQSGSGKSFSLQAGLRYAPGATYHEVHGLSQKALVHAARHNLKYKFLIIQEAAGFARGDGWVYLRQLLTEGKIKYMTVKQTRNGHEGADLATVEGPMGVMMTTTANALHGEDETRLLSLYVDQSPEQIEQAIMMHAEEAAPRPTEEDLSRWHALHNFVCSGNTKVIIPFRKELLSKLPLSYPRVLRDIPKVLALIRAHAILHQMTRDHDGDSIIANIDDYAMVYRLISEPLSFGLKASVPRHILEVVDAVIELNGILGRPVSQADVAEYLDRDQGIISRNIATAIKDGFVINRNPGQGRVHEYVPGERQLPSRSVLPTPAELRTAVAMSHGLRMEEERQAALRREQELVPVF